MGYVTPHVSMIAGMALMSLAFVFEVVGLAAPGWFSMTLGEKGETMVGLWEYCYERPKLTCEDVETEWSAKGWLEACRTLGILAMMAQVVCVVSFLLLCCARQFPLFFAVVAWSAVTAGLLIFIEFSVFVGEVEMKQNSMGRDFYYEYAFVLTIIAFLLSLLASVCFFIGEARSHTSFKKEEKVESFS